MAPVVVGGKDRTVLIYLDPKKLEARHLSLLDVVDALKQGNLMVTPGIAYFGDNQVLLDTNVMVDKVEELNDLPIRIEPGNSVYLRDIGQAEDSYAIQTSRVRIDGRARRCTCPSTASRGPAAWRSPTASRTSSRTWRNAARRAPSSTSSWTSRSTSARPSTA